MNRARTITRGEAYLESEHFGRLYDQHADVASALLKLLSAVRAESKQPHRAFMHFDAIYSKFLDGLPGVIGIDTYTRLRADDTLSRYTLCVYHAKRTFYGTCTEYSVIYSTEYSVVYGLDGGWRMDLPRRISNTSARTCVASYLSKRELYARTYLGG